MIYNTRTGITTSDSGSILAKNGGAGLGIRWNNPSGEDLHMQDPIPSGCRFRVLAPINTDPDRANWDPAHLHVGHFAIPLELISGTTSRSGFYVHGFSEADVEAISALPANPTPEQLAKAHTSSNGCIEYPLGERLEIAYARKSGDETLETI